MIIDHFVNRRNQCLEFSSIYYRLTRTLKSLTTQTDLSRTDEWSCYAIAFETLLPKEITKYMYDSGEFEHHSWGGVLDPTLVDEVCQ
jgi:hypothetical protein